MYNLLKYTLDNKFKNKKKKKTSKYEIENISTNHINNL